VKIVGWLTQALKEVKDKTPLPNGVNQHNTTEVSFLYMLLIINKWLISNRDFRKDF